MEHILDNPVWHSLVGPHAEFALGSGLARHYPRDFTPFSAIAEPSAAAYADLAVDLRHGAEARLFRPREETTPEGWQTLSSRQIVQMVATDIPSPSPDLVLTKLGADDVNDMRELAEETRPGPFEARTYALGNYIGYREHGRLLAMGGQRFRLHGFVELSAICVRPEARGRGVGAAITCHLARTASEEGAAPFLHVFPDNPAAALYQRLGFRERRRLYVVWQRRT